MNPPNIAETVFATISEPTSPGRPPRPGTLLTRQLAVAVYEPGTDPERGNLRPIDIKFRDGFRTSGRVTKLNASLHLEFIELDAPVPWELPGFLEAQKLIPQMTGTAIVLASDDPLTVEGRIIAADGSPHGQFGLIPEDGEYLIRNARFKGAPLLIEGRLAGVVTAMSDGALYALYAGGLERPVQSTENDSNERTLEQIFARLSYSSKNALAVADSLRRVARRPDVELVHLIAGLVQKEELLDSLLAKSGVDRHALVSTIANEVRAFPPPSFAPLQVPPPCSSEVMEALRAADKAAPGEVIEAAYVLWAALSVTTSKIVQRLADVAIRAEHVDLPRPLPPPFVPPPPNPDTKEYITRLQADGVDGVPLLGIEREVNALCAVLASKDAQPPLSVGLFGNWGSGKSFFMERMQKKFDAIQAVARRRTDSPWCANIVQVKFNAWHYIDTSLWANLTSEVFEQLSDELRRQSPQEPALKDKLIAVAAGSRDALGEAERKRDSAQEALKAGMARLEALKDDAEKLETVSPAVVLKGVYKEVVSQPEVRDQLKKVADDLKLPAAKKATDDALAQLLELKGFAGWAVATVKSIRLTKGTWAWSVLFAVAAYFAFKWLQPTFKDLGDYIKSSTQALTAAFTFLSPYMLKAKGITARIDKLRNDHEKEIKDKKDAHDNALESQKRQLQESVKLTELAVDQARKTLADVEDQLDALRADRELFAFIQERHRSEDYTRHLGLIAKARGDFERLSALMTKLKEEEGNKAEDGAKTTPAFPRVDRIVLYIDDLDRCPEKLVVEVLQAVHLLLAFPLFVVVVGVDPRWLLHSLRQHCVAFKGKPGELDQPTPEELDEWRTTPLNYLEKIFQIPFTLRPMTPKGFTELIDQWNATEQASRKTEPPPVPQENIKEKPAGPAKPADQDPSKTKETETPPVKVAPKVDPPKDTTPLPEPVGIKDEEWKAIKILGPLIPTPRAAKRFVNLYRLLRASLPPAERDAFIARGYRGAQLLLAMVTGHPEVGSELVAEAIRRKPKGSWWDFASGYWPGTESPRSEWWDFTGSQRPETGKLQSDASLVHALYEDFKKVQKEMGDLDCEDFQPWMEEIARYSFRSGRVLIDVAVS